MNETGVILEGGGMRGVYTGGVLEYWLEQGLKFPYVVGVSAGACNATSYISGQPGRNKEVTIGLIGDKRYLSVRNLWRERSLFGMNFIFDKVPNEIIPFDFDTFYNSSQDLIIGTTDAHTGEAIFYRRTDLEELTLKLVRASSSLPFASPPVQHGGRTLFDGGIAAPIPIEQSIKDGNTRHIVVLTQPLGYRKMPSRMGWLTKRFYSEYPGLIQAMEERASVYNATLERLAEMEKDGNVIIIRPSRDLQVGRMEKSTDKLESLYELGYRDAEAAMDKLRNWL